MPAVLGAAYVWHKDWQFGRQGDSALMSLHALARRFYNCSAKHCPGNQVVKITRGMVLRVVKPDGTKLIYQLKQKPHRLGSSDLTGNQIAKYRSDLGPTTVTITACNPKTWWWNPHRYRHRVTATFTFVKAVTPKR